MFRILFFLAICALAFYGVYSAIIPNALQKTEYSSLDFDNYLNEAIIRNTPPQKKYTLVFLKEDFIDESIIDGDINIIDSSNSNTGMGNVSIVMKRVENISSSKGNFGTPSIESQGAGYTSDCSAGLIFDPCLVIGDPIPANGGMYFGSDRI